MFRIVLSLIVSSCLVSSDVWGANVKVEGRVKDATTGDPLPSANVVLIGTVLGASADVNGMYTIRNVPPGQYTIRASYLGYEAQEETVEVVDGVDFMKNFSLSPVTLQGEEVVVTAQAYGQKAAINAQLAANQIVSVVSSARIQELPDANAAEAIGRLPGVSIIRSGGEGTQIVIRGLQPKYNNITVDGVRLASSGAADRGADLSMISPHMLEGIEVSKTVTADQDADVLGGSVNFKMKEAGLGTDEQKGLGFSLLAEGAYNGLPNASNKFRNYKYVGSVEGRFFEDRSLGMYVQADVERRNLSSNELGASYTNMGASQSQYLTTGLNLFNIPRDRTRTNALVVIDYRLPDGKISLMNLGSSGKTDIVTRSEIFNVPSNLHNYALSHSRNTLNLLTNVLSLEQQLSMLRLYAKLSHSYSETDTPDDWSVTFQQGSAGLGSLLGMVDIDPKIIPPLANNDTNGTSLVNMVTSSNFSRERALTGSVDLEFNVGLTDLIDANVKFGGKLRRQTRSYLHDQFTGQGLGQISARTVDSLIASHFPSTTQYVNTNNIPILPFIDMEYDYGEFLGGDYPMVMPLNYAMIAEMVRFIQTKKAFLASRNDIAYFHDLFNSTTNNYSGVELLSAFYVMSTFHIGGDLTIIPGIRYQNLQTSYTAARGRQTTASATGGGPYDHYDTTVTVNHGYWLPNVNVHYKPVEWCDLRLAYYNTIAYPDYISIIPRIDVSTGSTIAWNNFKLEPSRSTNYDAYLSFYDNTIGLLTMGAFLKRIDNLIFATHFYVTGAEALKYYPPSQTAGTPPPTNAVFDVNTFVNNPYRINNYGIELDWQTHFWYLSRPLDGLVFNINFTHIFSKAEYPYTLTVRTGRVISYVDTSYIDRLLYQPNTIVNLSVGYDYDGFSMRISMIYKTDIFTGSPGYYRQLGTTTLPYRKWDISVKQKLPWFGLQVYGDINNLTGAHDVSVIIAPTGVPQSEQLYDLTAVLGIRFTF